MSEKYWKARAERTEETLLSMSDALSHAIEDRAELEQQVQKMADEIGRASKAHYIRWREGDLPYYEGRSDQAGEDKQKLRALLNPSVSGEESGGDHE